MHRKYDLIQRKTLLILMGCLVVGAIVYAYTAPYLPTRNILGPEGFKIRRPMARPMREAAPLPLIPTLTIWGALEVLKDADPDTAQAVQPSHPEEPVADFPPMVVSLSRSAPRPALRRPSIDARPRGDEELQAPLEAPAHGVMARFQAPPRPISTDEAVDPRPETLTREEIRQVMGTIRGAIQRCYDLGMVPGLVDLTLTVEGISGRVIQAITSEESSIGACIRRLALSLSFPPFSRPQVTVKYPYSFR